MLLLSPARVAQGLRAGTLTETQKARLMIAGVMLSAILANLSPRGFRTWGDVLYLMLYLIGMSAGIWACYRANDEGDGHWFVERYVCLSVPLTILFYVIYIVLFYSAYFLLRDRPAFGPSAFTQTVKPYALLMGLTLLFAYFVTLRAYIRQISAPLAA